MKIRHVLINGFRGIKHLEWSLPDDSIFCLIGPGDSTKSTILDAVELALSPRWNINIYDTDFYQCKIDQPIDIFVTVGDLPERLLTLEKFGTHLRGWKDGKIVDEPVDDCKEVVTVHLTVDRSLEPSWSLFTDRNPGARTISAREREALGMTRLGPYVDRQLSWGHGTALSRLTDDLDNVPVVLAEAGRSARGAVDSSKLPQLETAADQAQDLAVAYGVRPNAKFHPALDPLGTNESVGALTLFDGEVPARQSGQGTRRLLTLAIQQRCVQDGSIQLIDEIEQGLEPHRVRHLLHTLKSHVERPGENQKGCQIIMTTHSNVVIEELRATNLFIVRSQAGVTKVNQVSADLQATIRAESVALLGRKIIVCEGKTELGMCRAFDHLWALEERGKPFAHIGAVPVDGGGSEAPKRALNLTRLGYDVAYFADSDCEINPDANTLSEAGIEVIIWKGKVSTDQRVCLDLPWQGLQELIHLAIDIKEDESTVLSSVASRLKCRPEALTWNLTQWLELGFSEEMIRAYIGETAKSEKQKWFKMIHTGELLGQLVYRFLPKIGDKDLCIKIDQLKRWING